MTIANIVLNTESLLRVDFRCSYLTNYVRRYTHSLTIVIISLCICISNHHTIHLSYIQVLFKIKKIKQNMILLCSYGNTEIKKTPNTKPGQWCEATGTLIYFWWQDVIILPQKYWSFLGQNEETSNTIYLESTSGRANAL